MRILTDNALRDMLRDMYIEGLRIAQHFHEMANRGVIVGSIQSLESDISSQVMNSVPLKDYLHPITPPAPPKPTVNTHRLTVRLADMTIHVIDGVEMSVRGDRSNGLVFNVEMCDGHPAQLGGVVHSYEWTPLPDVKA